MLSIIATFQTLGFNLKDRLQREEKGATAVEYALLVGVMAVLIIAGLTVFGDDLAGIFKTLTDDLGLTTATT
jgi:pilus assembly protein Flp/PilA